MYKYGRCTIASNLQEELTIFNIHYQYEEVLKIYNNMIPVDSNEMELKELLHVLLKNGDFSAAYEIYNRCNEYRIKKLNIESRLKELVRLIDDKHPTDAPIYVVNDIKALLEELYSPINNYYDLLSNKIFVNVECTIDALSLEEINKSTECFINQNKMILERYRKEEK